MTDAVWDTRTHTRATRFAATVDVDWHNELPRIDQPDRASMTLRRPRQALRLNRAASWRRRLTGIGRQRPTKSGHTHAAGSKQPHALNRASRRPRSCSRTAAVAEHNTRQQLAAPAHPAA